MEKIPTEISGLPEIALISPETQAASDKTTEDTAVNNVSSAVLARLIEEVRNEEAYSINAYNRMHNRHNRSR